MRGRYQGVEGRIYKYEHVSSSLVNMFFSDGVTVTCTHGRQNLLSDRALFSLRTYVSSVASEEVLETYAPSTWQETVMAK